MGAEMAIGSNDNDNDWSAKIDRRRNRAQRSIATPVGNEFTAAPPQSAPLLVPPLTAWW
jgi:hypothetical protein